MSDTPRSDAEANGKNPFGTLMGDNLRNALVPSDFARQLERELAAAQIGAARYEFVRTLCPAHFRDLWWDCMRNHMNFDAEVDRRRTAK